MSFINDFNELGTVQKIAIGIGACCIGVILLFIIIGLASPDVNTTSNINVSDVSVVSSGYGMYDVSAVIVPDRDYSYLEMVIIFYDDSGAVIDTSPLAWNQNDLKEGQVYKVSGNGYVSGNNVATKAEIGIFDSAFSGSDMGSAIWTQEVTI